MRTLVLLAALMMASTCEAQVILGAGHPSSPQYGRYYSYRPYTYSYRPYYQPRCYGHMPYGGGAIWLQQFHTNWTLEAAAANQGMRDAVRGY